jgi:ribosomal protein S20
MAKKKAGLKALRKSKRLADHNRSLKTKIKDLRKKAMKQITANKADTAMAAYRELQVAVDKASKHNGFMKKNTAARYKSQLGKRIAALKAKA